MSITASTEVRVSESVIDPWVFRQVLGQYPTGVCVVTAMQSDGSPTGMVVGSFTSASLNPPLVAFFADRKSGSWARLSACARFCVNILSAEQEAVCRKLASREPEKFAGISFEPSPGGSPIISGSVAWIDCDLDSVNEAGDHFIVMGRVRRLEIAFGGLPLLFFQGGYGRFAPSSMVTSETQGILREQLQIIDRARPEMERIAAQLSAQCLATTRVGEGMLVAASAGQASHGTPATAIGQRLPFIAPVGSVFAAWLEPGPLEQWLSRSPTPAAKERFRTGLAAVRQRGYAVWLLNDAQQAFELKIQEAATRRAELGPEVEKLMAQFDCDPADLSDGVCAAIRMISAPIFDKRGNVALALSIGGFPKPSGCAEILDFSAQLVQSAERLTVLFGGHKPP